MTFTVRPLGELCNLTMGRTPSRGNSKYWDPSRATKNVWISIADITKSVDGILLDSKEYLSDEGSQTFSKVKKGTLLLSFKLSIGKLAIAGTDLQTNEAIVAMNDLNERLILRDYLFYYLLGFDWSDALEGRFKVKGNTLNKQILDALPIKFPSLEKQRVIVEKLKTTFAEIDKFEKNCGHLKDVYVELMSSIQVSSYGKNVNKVKIGDVCKLMTGGTPSRTRDDYFKNGTVKWLVSGDIHKTEIYDCEGRITVEAMKSANTKILPMNSVMIALNGQGKTRGSVAILRTEATCNQSLVSISPVNSEQLLPEFLFYNLRMRYQELRRMTGDDGNDRRGLNMILIREIVIPLPSLPDQIEIVKVLKTADESIQELVTQIRNKEEFITEIRRSLLSIFLNENREVA